ncbi:hypothetical protein [Halalkalibacter urbisdiaboli]|uniref:hypothetical protein n=1 Tax=Halalkalibacter urbisdiaboli TaxID=1960589 RepID=UPI000B44E19E|nr:hypothetical protein [Halalkalibacter urbisdiaboli]
MNYEQVNVVYNKKEVPFLELNLDEYSNGNFEIEVSGIREGRSDFLVMAVRNPDEFKSVERYIPPQKTYLARRSTLIYKHNQQPSINYHDISSTSNISNKLPVNPFLSYSPETNMKNALITVSYPFEKLWLNFANDIDTNNKFAVIALHNNKQVDLEQIFFRQTSDEFVQHLPLLMDNIENIDNEGNLFFVCLIENPYELIENDNKRMPIPCQSKFTNQIKMIN